MLGEVDGASTRRVTADRPARGRRRCRKGKARSDGDKKADEGTDAAGPCPLAKVCPRLISDFRAALTVTSARGRSLVWTT